MSIRKGLTILLKAANKNVEKDDVDPYVEELKKLNLDPMTVPVLDFHFINKEELLSCLRRWNDFSGIVFSSPRAIEAIDVVFDLCPQDERRNLLLKWQDKVNFAVGEATALAADSQLSFHCVGKQAGSAESLVPIILEKLQPTSKPILFPCSSIRKETISSLLQAQGLEVHEVFSYETVVHPAFQLTLQNIIESKGVPEIIVVFSPSGVQSMIPICRLLQFPLNLIKYAAIGTVTSRALQEANLVPWCTSKMPTPKALAASIQEALQNTHC